MPPYTWPTELDDAQRLLAVVGSFWHGTYAGNDLVGQLLSAKARTQAQAHADLLELVASISRFSVPVFHTENWFPLTLRESDRNAANLPTFDGTYRWDGQARFDAPETLPLFAWPAPAGLADAKVVTAGVVGTPVAYTAGVDFYAAGGAVWFRADPFLDPGVRVTAELAGGAVADRLAHLWVYRGEYDWDTVYRQFGYALGVRLASSRPARDLVNAVYDGLVEGTTARCLEDFMAAACDVPLAAGNEVVRYVLEDETRKWVVTDANAYGFPPGAAVIVSPGDAVRAGDPLTDALRFYDFGGGVVPDAVRAVAAGRGLLAAGYYGELVFENKSVPLVVAEAPGEYTRVEFEVGGWAGDVRKFWDDVHAAGVAAGDTLAMRLDTRTNKTGQPTAAALPAAVNPLEFLVGNVLRGNAFAVVVRPSGFGPGAVGMSAARLLRRLVPPQTLCLVIVQLDRGETVTMDGPGGEAAPGYEEAVTTFSGSTAADAVDPAAYVEEEVRAVQVGGRCE